MATSHENDAKTNKIVNVLLTATMLVSGLAVSILATVVVPAAAHECPPEGCVLDGRMTGGGRLNSDITGIIVTHGFELYCNIEDGPNNLEVNWDSGNRFHLESLTRVVCLDNPAYEPNPPPAPFDFYEADGVGSYNGVEGAQIHFEFTDKGEPGTNDTAFIVIRDASGAIVLEANADLEVGNHQAHRMNK